MDLVQHVIGDFLMSGLNLTFFRKLWIRLLKINDDLMDIKWIWQSLDSISKKSSLEER
ncbi:MAG: hypothetical protein ABJB73_10385 [Candidatus Nitrosocosmicus sp.]